jgi:hypothetical protein
MKCIHTVIIVIVIFLFLTCSGTLISSRYKRASLLQKIKSGSLWDDLWNTATELKVSAQTQIEFTIGPMVFTDKFITDKKDAETIMEVASRWGLEQRTNASIPPHRFQWRHGPTMQYLNNVVYVSPETLSRFRDTDFALAAVHEVVGHHFQETNALGKNKRLEQEGCAMTCEKVLFQEIAPALVSRWRLMRYVRALIDLQTTAPVPTRPPPREIYEHFGVYTMTLESILNSVKQHPGFSLNYLDSKKGLGCAC